MAISTLKSTEQTAIAASDANRRLVVNLDQRTLDKKVARFNVTGTGTVDTGSYFDLGKLVGVNGAVLVIEECRLRYTGTVGAMDVKFTLKKANAAEQASAGAGTITALSAATATIAAVTATTVLAAVATAGTSYAVDDTDMLRLYLTTGAAAAILPATVSVEAELTYTVPGC